MPIDLKAIPDRLKQAAQTGTLVPFIGAGASQHASGAGKGAFPTWSDLLKRLQKIAVKDGYISSNESAQIDALVKRG